MDPLEDGGPVVARCRVCRRRRNRIVVRFNPAIGGAWCGPDSEHARHDAVDVGRACDRPGTNSPSWHPGHWSESGRTFSEARGPENGVGAQDGVRLDVVRDESLARRERSGEPVRQVGRFGERNGRGPTHRQRRNRRGLRAIRAVTRFGDVRLGRMVRCRLRFLAADDVIAALGSGLPRRERPGDQQRERRDGQTPNAKSIAKKHK